MQFLNKLEGFDTEFHRNILWCPFVSLQGDINWLGQDEEPLTGFSWRGGSEPETTGIQLWSEVFPVQKSDGTEVCALFVCQAIGTKSFI